MKTTPSRAPLLTGMFGLLLGCGSQVVIDPSPDLATPAPDLAGPADPVSVAQRPSRSSSPTSTATPPPPPTPQPAPPTS